MTAPGPRLRPAGAARSFGPGDAFGPTGPVGPGGPSSPRDPLGPGDPRDPLDPGDPGDPLDPLGPGGATGPAGATGRLGRLGRVLAGQGRLAPLLAAALLGFAVLGAVLAPLLAPHDPNAVDLGASLAGPGGGHPLGADQQGRDVLSRLLYGARSSLVAPLVIVVLSTALGSVVGLAAGWRRGLLDAALSRALEVGLALPGVLIALVLVTRLGPGPVAPVVAVALWLTPYVARLVRTATIEEVALPYVDAYRTTGWGPLAIALRAVLPNVAGLVLARAAVNAGIALVALASLSFLGFGVQPPAADWGAMINEGLEPLQAGDPWPALAPAACLVAVVLAVNVLGEALADRLGREGR